MKRVTALVLCALLVMAASVAAGEGKTWKIGVSTQGWRHEFIKNLVNAMQAIDKERADVTLILVDSEDSIEKQLNDIDTLIAQGVNGIIMNGNSMEGASPAVGAAKRAGIPLVELVSYTEDKDFATFVGTDVKSSGILAGEILAKLAGEKGNILELQGIMGSSGQVNRGAGIAEAMKKFPNMKIADQQTGEYSKDKAMAVTETWLAKYPKGQVAGIVAHNDGMALGAMNACISANRPEIKIVGIDGDSEALQGVIDGTMGATIVDYVEQEVKLAVEEMVGILNGNPPKKQIVVDYVPVTTPDQARKFLELRK